jgi:catechol 2,3-dioxygenase-like lactoylglutathione lyase family enzyme
MTALRLHHVNITVPDDGLPAETAFLVDVIGLRHLEPGVETPPTANWFAVGAGVQIHVSLDANHRASERAHVALDYEDGLAALEHRITDRAVAYRALEDDTGRRLFLTDPAGNLWELRGLASA